MIPNYKKALLIEHKSHSHVLASIFSSVSRGTGGLLAPARVMPEVVRAIQALILTGRIGG